MLLHHRDTNEPIGTGLIHLALILSPQALRGLCTSDKTISNFRDALTQYGIAVGVSLIVTSAPDSFLHPGVLSTIRSKTEDSSLILADIISKSDVLSAPGSIIDELEEVLGQRQYLAECLKRVNRIHMGLSKLLAVLW